MEDIKQVVTNSDKLQNDPDGFADLLTEDANLVNIAGRRLHGRENIRAAYRKAMASQLAQVQTRIEIHDAWLVQPDVAVVTATKHVSDERDEPNAPLPDKGAVTFVLAKRGEQWLIASVQTTPIK
ncbi:SgcJ/EcaC family oxidoreductase [Kibdelosporangium aridum]|uniref:DUF4440 domain-containing protein n=1 Tax=Kibdelosporangium aridum TaxID=2030 RepID=A0A1Y5WZV3_KIBAR|nr:SgcJ/EcaC family oxidoreductase [Kibdelosporangium aridum]SMC62124.1 conserved hypothetical protein [Kibdelosporangium aridum]